MAYGSASDVGALTRNLLGSANEYDTTTCPTLVQVTAWLSSGCALIEAVLAERGYGALPASSAAYGVAAQANALYAAWMAERSRINARLAQGERTRADMFKKDFQEMLDMLKAFDLSRMGLTQTSTAYAGGISASDKQTVEDDDDRTQPRFTRGDFRNVLGIEGGGTAQGGDPQGHNN